MYIECGVQETKQGYCSTVKHNKANARELGRGHLFRCALSYNEARILTGIEQHVSRTVHGRTVSSGVIFPRCVDLGESWL